MKKKILSAALCLAVAATMLAGCGAKEEKEPETQVEESAEGKVLNIYCWNEEFKTRVTDHYDAYEEVDATTGKIGDITVNWNITANEDNAYQNNLDATLEKQADAKALVDAGYAGTHALWSDDWSAGFYPEGKVFCYFGPAWLVNFSMAADTEGSIGYQGGWGATEGPQGFFWGGTWICAATGTDNVETIKDIMLTLTADEEVMTEIVRDDDDFVNNKPAMEAMAEDDTYSSAILGGINPLAMYCAGAESINLENISAYDQACNEEFQNAMKNYFEGNATLDEAKDLFFKAVTEKHPELTY